MFQNVTFRLNQKSTKKPECKIEEGEAVSAEADVVGVGSEGAQGKAEADAQDKEGGEDAEGTESGQAAATATEERGSVEFGVGIEIGEPDRAKDGWMAAEGVEEEVFGRDPPRTEAGASCSRGAADTPCMRKSDLGLRVLFCRFNRLFRGESLTRW